MHHHDHTDDHDRGLLFDLHTMASRAKRRDVLRMLAGTGLVTTLSSLLIACGDSGSGGTTQNTGGGTSGTGTSGTGTSGTGTSGGGGATGTSGTSGAGTGTGATGGDACSVIPSETEGPFPGDGSNGPNALNTTGVVRSDLRSSFGGLSGTAAGVPLVVQLNLTNVNASCAPLPGYAIYMWHCDKDGRYSMYDLPGQNYLRGVQVTDELGSLMFTTIFPGCYQGRWPHIHFEIYPSQVSISSAANKVRTSQIALPSTACSQVYATSGYESSVGTFQNVSLQSDNVFGDGADLQIPLVSGNVTDGFVIMLDVGIAV